METVSQALEQAHWIAGHSVAGDLTELVEAGLPVKEEWVRGDRALDSLLLARMKDERRIFFWRQLNGPYLSAPFAIAGATEIARAGGTSLRGHFVSPIRSFGLVSSVITLLSVFEGRGKIPKSIGPGIKGQGSSGVEGVPNGTNP